MREKEVGMVRLLMFTLWVFSYPAFADSDSQICLNAIKENPKQVHLNNYCLSAANDENPNIQYAVGMSFGYAGNSEKELYYYNLAAKGSFAPAYLALGHVLRSSPYNDEESAIKWYEKYTNTKQSGYGYSAILLSKLYAKHGNDTKSQYWLSVCKESDYSGCGN